MWPSLPPRHARPSLQLRAATRRTGRNEMRVRTTIWLTALSCAAVVAAVIALALHARPAEAGGATTEHHAHAHHSGVTSKGGKLRERFLYVSTVAQSATDPDFIAVIGADPRRADFGRIVNRIDMPNVGDEVHHYGYSSDRKRLLVPGLFSSRIHVFDIKAGGARMVLKTVNDQLKAKS